MGLVHHRSETALTDPAPAGPLDVHVNERLPCAPKRLEIISHGWQDSRYVHLWEMRG
jgi:hypothetical protein